MAYQPTEWKNRLVERPRTYQLQQNADGTVTQIPAEGEIFEEGTPVNAGNMNHIEQGIKDAYELAAAAETPSGAQAKVDALAGEGNTATVKAVDDALTSHLSDNSLHAISTILADNIDLNTVTRSGFYRLSTTNPNTPAGCAYGQLLVVHGAMDTILQIASGYNGESPYYRNGNPPDIGGTGSWSAWKRLLNQDDYNQLFQYANDGKTGIANAVTAKGVAASPSDTFATLAGKIGQIQTGPIFVNSDMTTEILLDDGGTGKTSTQYVESQHHIVKFGGSIRTKFKITSDKADGIAYGRIYVNGAPVGAEHSTAETAESYAPFFYDTIDNLKPGDRVSLYLKNSHSTYPTTWLKYYSWFINAGGLYGY